MAETSLTVLAWIGVVALIVVGVLGAVVPILPGAVFVFAGIALGAWIDDFTRVSGTVVIIAAVLMALAWIVDYLSAMLGAQRVGASRQAVIGALIGTVAGVFTGLVGVLFLPLVGAAVGEFIAVRDVPRAGTVGVATWIGMIVGIAVKLALSFMMIGLFVFALLF
ncbi:MAG: DUF456 domain-containing protein [Gemmatimonadales bacterium]|jgi:uncharacterized protein YqgC (DUF456 family)|nr:DUF456 domain-containing protein [Gemmatimonadales bacterium]